MLGPGTGFRNQRTQGILSHRIVGPTEQMRALGCDRRVISADEAVRIEPALTHVRPQLAGATYTAEDESGDANLFARELVKLCEADGVKFLMNHTITALREAGGKLDHVEATDKDGRFQRIRGDAYVLCMGSFSPLYAAPLGIRLPIYPAKGYSVTLPVKDESMAHRVSLTDDEYKLVFSRLGDRLRIEDSGIERLRPGFESRSVRAIVRRVEQLFPGAGDTGQAQFWTGLRPATPSNVPIIGKSKLPNFFLNTGHGTLGWTHSCGSGKSIARIVSGLKPEVEFEFAGM